MQITQQRKRKQQRTNRARRVRGKLHGTGERPRLSVYRSNQHVYVQAINDDAGHTVAAATDSESVKGTKTERAAAVAKQVAGQLKKAGVEKVIFDRGFYRYHGRVKMVAETLRSEGIQL